MLDRRAILALSLLALAPRRAWAAAPDIDVYSDPSCGCCGAWVRHLEANGFRVRTHDLAADALTALKRARGITDALASCHTALVGGYVVEGHVPAADIRRLIAENAPARGLAVPGMPGGSPGMEGAPRERFDVLLIDLRGGTRPYATY